MGSKEKFMGALRVLARAVAFYVASSFLYSFLRCSGTNLLGVSRVVVFLAGVVSWGVGSLVEDPDRRLGILLWQAQNFLQVFGTMMMTRGLFSPVHNGTTYCFALAVGILNHFFVNEPSACDPTAATLMKAFIGKNREMRSLIESRLFGFLIKDKAEFSWIDIVTGMVNNFSVGYLLLQLIATLTSLAAGGSAAVLPALKATHPSAVQLGKFLSLLNSARGLGIFFRYVFKTKKLFPGAEFIFGAMAGLSIANWSSIPVAMWVVALAVNTLVCKYGPLVWKKGSKPVQNYPPGLPTTLVYSLTTATTLYALQSENHLVREGAQGFISAMAGGQDPKHYKSVSAVLGEALQIPQKPVDWWF